MCVCVCMCVQGFFRRSVKERDCLKYQCPRNGSCMITFKTRNVCKACRYNQCLRVGMEPESECFITCSVAFLAGCWLHLQKNKYSSYCTMLCKYGLCSHVVSVCLSVSLSVTLVNSVKTSNPVFSFFDRR